MADFTPESHTMHAVRLAGTATTKINQIQTYDIDPGLTVRREGASGEVTPSHAHAASQQGRILLSTTDVAAAITLCGRTGVKIPYVDAVFEMFMVKKELATPTAYTANEAVKFTVNSGLLILRSISCNGNGNAVANLELVVTQEDVANDPFSVSDVDQTFPTPDELVSTVFGIGNGYWNGDKLAEISSIMIDTGLSIETIPQAGSLAPAAAFIRYAEPNITINTPAGRLVTDLFHTGTAPNERRMQGGPITGTTRFHLQQRVEGGGFVAPATASHIRCSVYEGMGAVGRWSARSATQIGYQLQVFPTYKGAPTNEIMTLATGLAISVA